jgi:glycosyltransferase involved in cell wall biosynthesis
VKNQLVVIHDAAVWDVPEGFRTSFRLLYQRLLPALARRARKIATVSQFSRERLAERLRISPDRIAVLGNGIDERFCPSSTRETEHEPFLLCVGSLDPRKNLDRLLSAWLRLRKEGRIPERFQLKIIGSQNLRNFARVNSSDGNGVEWLGRLDDATLIDHYRSATAFVFPSLYEGFGLPPLEAMACGCPVVLSHAASIPEVGGPEFNPGLPPSDGTALYFDPLSEDELCRQLETVVRLGQDQRRILIENALARTRQFSWESVAFKASEEICQLL